MGVLAVLALWIYLPDGGRERHVRLDWTRFLPQAIRDALGLPVEGGTDQARDRAG